LWATSVEVMSSSCTSSNSVFAVRFAYPNAFGTSQTRKTLYAIAFT